MVRFESLRVLGVPSNREQSLKETFPAGQVDWSNETAAAQAGNGGRCNAGEKKVTMEFFAPAFLPLYAASASSCSCPRPFSPLSVFGPPSISALIPGERCS